jgi:uncharacterized membrane protein
MNETEPLAGRDARLARAEILLSYLLRFGVLLCGAVIAAGLLLSWVGAHSPGTQGGLIPLLLQGRIVDQTVPSSWAAFAAGLSALDPSTVIASGLVLLIALPVARVAMTVVLFFFERDWAYVVVTLIVLSVLLSSILLGKAL